ncbi:hypothetical protein [Mycolicibacterium goodii]|uniref:Anti-sigma-M factor RsmA n=1 Tax=Mycolicibacterium goodii TaxID=134601 RepID=A0A0K0X2V0_MYCGD|nr:hypothetical protein AFA91_06720 [Mycolicibacterium goodii]
MNRSPRAPIEGPITPELLADLQAGLLDDATAARVRRRVRDDPAAADMLAALDRVRRDVAELGPETAPPVPAEVSAKLIAALRTAETPARVRRWRRLGAVVGGGAVLAAVAVGVATLPRQEPAPQAPTAQFGHITAKPRPTDVGLTEQQLLAVLAVPPDYGPLADPARRTGCLAALGYPPGVHVLGARPLQVGGRAGVLFLLPEDRPGTLAALVVPADCGSGDAPEPIARTVLRQPAARP